VSGGPRRAEEARSDAGQAACGGAAEGLTCSGGTPSALSDMTFCTCSGDAAILAVCAAEAGGARPRTARPAGASFGTIDRAANL
jgi:hypothetical protein